MNTKTYWKVGERMTLQKLIESKGYTAKSLAEKIGVHEHTVNNYVNGKSDPSIGNAIAIADELGITLDEFAAAIGYRVK